MSRSISANARAITYVLRVAALKPVCSGNRADARALRDALAGELTLADINPWHYRAPIAPALAARQENQRLRLTQIVAHTRRWQSRFDWRPIIVGTNGLGVVNNVRLTLAALPPAIRARAVIVLMAPPKPDAATHSNVALLAEYCAADRMITLPWLGKPIDWDKALKNTAVRRNLARLWAII